MKTQLSDVSPVKKKLHVEVPANKVTEAFDKALEKVSAKAEVKGFRKGKVPKDMVQKMYQAELQEAALEEIVRASYVEAIQATKMIPISRPDITPGTLLHGSAFTYDAVFEIRPEVKVKGYDGLKLEGKDITVEAAEIEIELKRLQEALAEVRPALVGGIVGKDSMVTIDYTGTADGQPFSGNSATDFVVDIAAGNLLPAFSEKLMGASVGEVREFEVPYPADYFNKDLAGKKGKFNVTIKDLKTKVLPDLNDDFAKDVAKGGTLSELKDMIKKEIQAGKERQQKRELAEQAMQKLLEAHDFEIPETLKYMELQSLFEQFQHQLSQRKQKLEEVGMTPEKFVQEYTKVAESRVRGYLILDAISEVETIAVTDDDVETHFQELAGQLGEPVTKIRAFYEQDDRKNALKARLIQEKTLDFIVDKAKIKKK